MCGICGVVGGGPVEPSMLEAMKVALRHRGPDDDGCFVQGQVGFGFVRLSIVDLSPLGHQPMTTRDGRFTIVYNGEVFNHQELHERLVTRGVRFSSSSDSEVVLYAFAEWGVECLQLFNGMFAFAIHDAHTGRVLLARDRFGIKPLYLYRAGRRWLFASEIKAIQAALPAATLAVDTLSVFDYLAYDRVDHTERTFFQGVTKLSPGHYVELDEFGAEAKPVRWYDLSANIAASAPTHQEYREEFSRAVGLALRGDVPVGVSLSGGLDSSSIVATLIHSHRRRDFPVFSAVYGAGAPGDESAYIQEFASSLQHMHRTRPSVDTLLADLEDFVTTHGEPVPRTGPYAQYKVMQLAGSMVKVTLEGQGADEALAGYLNLHGFYFQQLLRTLKWKTLTREYYATLRARAPTTGFSSALLYQLPRPLRTRLAVARRGHLDKCFLQEHMPRSTVPRLFLEAPNLRSVLINMLEHKLEHLLKWTDHNAMRFSVESRVPFLDHRLVERTLALPESQIIRDGKSKYILRQAMAGLVPDKILQRRDKVGFGTPEAEWFRQPGFQSMILDVLHSSLLAQHQYLRRDKALELFKLHMDRRLNASRQIWKWINLYHWHASSVQPVRPASREVGARAALGA